MTVALSHIHSKNVLHRDLKTQNLLIDRHHKIIKISDFGISKVLRKSFLWLLPTLILGTKFYLESIKKFLEIKKTVQNQKQWV